MKKTDVKRYIRCFAGYFLVIIPLFITSCSSDENLYGDYTINLTAKETTSGSRHLLNIEGVIQGPACRDLKLTVNFVNEYANRAHKIILIKDIQENIPLTFSDFDEVFPTKENTIWRLGEVHAVCQD